MENSLGGAGSLKAVELLVPPTTVKQHAAVQSKKALFASV